MIILVIRSGSVVFLMMVVIPPVAMMNKAVLTPKLPIAWLKDMIPRSGIRQISASVETVIGATSRTQRIKAPPNKPREAIAVFVIPSGTGIIKNRAIRKRLKSVPNVPFLFAIFISNSKYAETPYTDVSAFH